MNLPTPYTVNQKVLARIPNPAYHDMRLWTEATIVSKEDDGYLLKHSGESFYTMDYELAPYYMTAVRE